MEEIQKNILDDALHEAISANYKIEKMKRIICVQFVVNIILVVLCVLNF